MHVCARVCVHVCVCVCVFGRYKVKPENETSPKQELLLHNKEVGNDFEVLKTTQVFQMKYYFKMEENMKTKKLLLVDRKNGYLIYMHKTVLKYLDIFSSHYSEWEEFSWFLWY